jgi:Fic family protein
LATASAQLEQATTAKDASQSKLSEKQSELEAMQTELAKAKEAMDQANAKATELEKKRIKRKTLRPNAPKCSQH